MGAAWCEAEAAGKEDKSWAFCDMNTNCHWDPKQSTPTPTCALVT